MCCNFGKNSRPNPFTDALLAFILSPITLIWSLISPLLSSESLSTRTILHKCVCSITLAPSILRLTYILRNSGVLKPGEMCLVLGCPGSGCTTFLKTIANNREDYAYIGGEVLYAGMTAQEMAKYYKGEVVYNEEGNWILLFTSSRF
jgi:ATP-binding cassette, subfamily G (WHITE), member 2, SNQ2